MKFSNFIFHENPSSGRRDVSRGRMDRRRYMTKLIVAFRNFAKAPKKNKCTENWKIQADSSTKN